jgi:pyruvate kinase
MKILPTIGPISNSLRSIKILNKYSSIFRLNGSHNSIDWHKQTINRIKKINSQNQVLLDIPGVKPRTGNKEKVFIQKNQLVSFYYKKNNFKGLSVPLTHPLPNIKKITNFTLSDGNFLFKIIKRKKDFIIAKSTQSFTLESKKGLNLPNSIYNDNRQLKLSLKFINKVKKLNFDLIGLSFIQNTKIIKVLKKKYPHYLIVSKIENSEGLKNAENICKSSDIIMIDRGDLGAEIGNDKLFDSINKIVSIAKKFGKPVVMATENLDSMINNNLPSKNDVVSLSYYHSLGIENVMLSDETATSKNFINTCSWLQNFIKKKDKKIFSNNKISNDDFIINFLDKNKNIPLILFSKKGYLFGKLQKLRSENKINIFTQSQRLNKITHFLNNVDCFLLKKFNNSNIDTFIKENIKKNKKLIFKKSNNAFLIYVNFPRKNSRANTITLVSKDDF